MRTYFLTVLFALFLCPAIRAGEDAEFQRSKGLYTLQEYQLAVEALDKFMAAFPKSERLEDAQLLLAESHYQLKHYADAAKAFDAFLAAHPQSARRSDALLRAMKSHAAVKNFESCLKDAAAFIDENRAKLKAAPPQDPLFIKLATALYHAGDSSYALKDFAKAQGYWEELLATIPKSPLAPDAADGLGWIYFDKKDFEKAAASFFAVAETPGHPRAAWAKLMQGRALAALNRVDDGLAAIKLAPTLSGVNPELEAECALRTAELNLKAGKLPEALAAYRRLAKDFSAQASTPPALAAAVSQLYDAKNFPETAELAAAFRALPAAGPAAANRAAIARIEARSLLALNKPAEALVAARAAVAESAASPAVQDNDRAASLMLLAELAPAEAPKLLLEVSQKFEHSNFALAAQYELARAAGEAGKFDEALKLSEALLRDLALETPGRSPAPPQLKRDALFAAGEFAFRKPDPKKAAEHLGAYLKMFGDKDDRADDIARKLAWSLHETGDDAGSAAALDAALAANAKSPHRAELLYVRALAAGKLGKEDDALKFDDLLAAEFPASPFTDDALYDSAAIRYKRREFEPCRVKLDALLARPALKAALKTPALQMRASANLQTSNYAGALADSSDLLSKTDTPPPDGKDGAKLNLPALRLIKAVSLLAMPGKEADALAALNELIAKGPADAPEIRQGISRRAYVLFKDKKYAEAKNDFLILSDPAKAATLQEAADAALHLAVIHRELKEIPQSKTLLEKLADQKLAGVAAFEAPFQLGNILFEAGDNPGAAKNYQRALAAAAEQKISAGSLNAARLNLAWSLKRMNEKEQAEKMFAELAAHDPAGPYAAEALFERGQLLLDSSKAADALAAFQQIRDKFSDSPFAEKALFLQARTEVQSGKFKEAAGSFELHLKNFPAVNNREALCGLAESRLHLNEIDGAREAFLKVLGDKGLETELNDPAERALLGLAEIVLKAGDAAGAKKMMLRILTEDPQSEWADGAFLISGQASEALKEPEKAIGYYRKLLAERPKSAHVPAAEERLRALGAPK